MAEKRELNVRRLVLDVDKAFKMPSLLALVLTLAGVELHAAGSESPNA